MHNMALKLNMKFDFEKLPTAVKVILCILPAIIISLVVVFALLIPKHQEIQALKKEITKQENEIAVAEVKAAKLAALRVENEKLKKRLDELKLQLPEEKEVSGLLKQVSDLGINSGLKIASWKPEQKRDHPSGIIYEIPVAVELAGSYHNLGVFCSSLTKLNRIVNISDIKAGDAKPQRNEAELKISFKATTFSSVPEKELQEKAAKAAGAKKK
jgi:type IV pilus assembly protein PilO